MPVNTLASGMAKSSPTPTMTAPAPQSPFAVIATSNPIPAPIARIAKKKSFRISTSLHQANRGNAVSKPLIPVNRFCHYQAPPKSLDRSLFSQQQLDHRKQAMEQIIDVIHVDDRAFA
jgi:hypothetical protein